MKSAFHLELRLREVVCEKAQFKLVQTSAQWSWSLYNNNDNNNNDYTNTNNTTITVTMYYMMIITLLIYANCHVLRFIDNL